MTTPRDNLLDRRRAVVELLRERSDLVVVCGLGSATWDVAAAGDHDRNFYSWGAMGGAAMMGLGLALARPEETVTVITGDGEMLMGLGALATIGVRAPGNLSIVVLDNRRFGETGMQESHTRLGTDLCGVARACGIPHVLEASSMEEVAAIRDALHRPEGCLFARIAISAAEHERVLPERDGAKIKDRVRAALGLS
ncbi:MAG: aldehyde dehydrogenase [Rhodospirillales bacterium]|nr:MAG: aldehyde dehydrogenase [Rhodospirillales bacterium]